MTSVRIAGVLVKTRTQYNRNASFLCAVAACRPVGVRILQGVTQHGVRVRTQCPRQMTQPMRACSRSAVIVIAP
jgi:hypothetical protein